MRERARMFQRAAPDALVVYGTKAFANVALMRLLAEEGLGADVSTLGELAFARRAGLAGERRLVHGNNKSDEVRAAAEAGALVVLDALDEPARAADAGVRRVLVRVTPGVEAETHEAIRTGHHGSKFGLDADEAVEAVRAALAPGSTSRACTSTSAPSSPTREPTCTRSRSSPSSQTAAAPSSTGRHPSSTWAAASGSGTSSEEQEPPVEELVRTIVAAVAREGPTRDLPAPRLIVEPGRALVGPAAFTLYRVGAVKQAGDRRYVAIDGGMSDNPRPQLYGRAVLGPAREPSRRGSRGRVHDRGQALRVRPNATSALRSLHHGAATCSRCRQPVPTCSG